MSALGMAARMPTLLLPFLFFGSERSFSYTIWGFAGPWSPIPNIHAGLLCQLMYPLTLRTRALVSSEQEVAGD